jgi:hypothetical protein
MKTARIRLPITLTLAFLTLLSFAPTYSVAGDKKPTLSKREVKVLLRTAKEPPEHRRIAEYYRQQAERLTNSAKEHQELATIYEKTPPLLAMESKHGTSFGQGGLCRRWAQLEAEQATIAEALARLHEEMAKAAEQK